MARKAADFFTDEEKNAIETVIDEVESKTSGEIVAMVVDQSDRYTDIEMTGSVLVAACISVYPSGMVFLFSDQILHRVLPSMSWMAEVPELMRYFSGLCAFVLFTIIFCMPLLWLSRKMPLTKRFFLHEKRKEREVRGRAIKAFHEHRLDRTRDATGVLFLISLLERKVYVLADHGIYAKISQAALDGFALAVADGVAHGRAGQSLCEAIRAIGVDLAQHFPAKHDDTNELPNGVISE